MTIRKMKNAAKKLIAAEGRKDTLAALANFAKVAGPEQVLELINCHEQALDERQALAEKVREWERCAANWMASPEAQQRQAGYQELAGKLAAATAERDAAIQQAAMLRAALAAVFGTDDLIALEVLKANYKHSGPTMALRRANEKIIAAIEVLISTHSENKA